MSPQPDVTTALLATVSALTRAAQTIGAAAASEISHVSALLQSTLAEHEDLRLVDALELLESLERAMLAYAAAAKVPR